MTRPSPYKGLAPFEDSELDAAFFFGRSREQGIITANLTAARLTLLYGLSGVGKSSILRAGVVRRLRALPGPLAVVVFDKWRDDPVERLADAVAAAVGGHPQGSLADTLEAASAQLGGELYVILDGAEEYFVYHSGESEPGTFAADFPDAATRPGLPAYFLLSLREDALAALDRFKTRIPHLFANSLRLDHLDRESAREAIVGPIERYNELFPDDTVELEPELVSAVLDQVASGKVDIGRTGRAAAEGGAGGGQVETPYLSLVMERLWDAEQQGGSHRLRLATLEGLGGAEQIVRDHLDDALAALSPESREAASEVFTHLVTRSGTKIAHSVADLADYAGVPETELAEVLQSLASERIVRPVAGGNGSARYEIFHDVLAGAVLAWRSRYATERALEQERSANRKRVRRLLVVIAVGLAAIAAMAAITVFALAQRSIALRERGAARLQARHVVAREFVADAQSQLSVDPELSLLLGLEAAKRDPNQDVEDVLRQALGASRVRAVIHTGGKPATAVAFSPDSETLAVGGADGIVRLVTVTGEPIREFEQGGPVTSLAFHPKGGLLMSAGQDGTAKVWRVGEGERASAPIYVFKGESADFSRDGMLILTASRDGNVRVFRTSDGEMVQGLPHEHGVRLAIFDPTATLVATVSGGEASIFAVSSGKRLAALPQRRVNSVAFSHDGSKVATAADDGVTAVWLAKNGHLYRALPHERIRVLDATFSSRDDLLLTAGSDGAARVWDIFSRNRHALIGGHSGSLTGASFSPALPGAPPDNWVLTSSRDGTARVSKADRATVSADLLGHRAAVGTAVFSPDGRLVATASRDGTARIWNANTYPDLTTLGRHDGRVLKASFSPDGARVVSASVDGTARIWDARATRRKRPIAVLEHDGRVNDASFAPDGRIVTASADGTARVWGPGGEPLQMLPHDADVLAASFSGDGKLVVTASADRTARIWNPATGAPLQVLDHPRAVVAGSFSQDGKYVVTACADRIARIWRVDDGSLVKRLRGHTGALVDVEFSPDGAKVVTASKDHTARVWDAHTGRLLHRLKGHTRALTSAVFSPDSKLILTASRDDDARLWDANTGKRVSPLRAHLGVVSDASFSPDGRWIVTAGPNSAGLWWSATGHFQGFLTGSRKPLLSASFSPDSRNIVTAGADGAVRIDRCELCGTLIDLVHLAQRRLAATGRAFTPGERKRYLNR